MNGTAALSTRQVSAAGTTSVADQRQQRDRRGRLGVPLARQQEVPEGVQRGGAERQRQRVERHAGDRTIGACT